MPAGNGTGPSGDGPMTGRGAGYCTGFNSPGYMNSGSVGRGFGPGIGPGSGRGPGYGGGRRGRRNRLSELEASPEEE